MNRLRISEFGLRVGEQGGQVSNIERQIMNDEGRNFINFIFFIA
jgi:hypothetical protein